MTAYQKQLLDLPIDELDMEVADIMGRLRDISEATGLSHSITATPGKDPVLIVDGEVSRNLSFAEIEIPDFMKRREQWQECLGC